VRFSGVDGRGVGLLIGGATFCSSGGTLLTSCGVNCAFGSSGYLAAFGGGAGAKATFTSSAEVSVSGR
jgi:hypothetical protein